MVGKKPHSEPYFGKIAIFGKESRPLFFRVSQAVNRLIVALLRNYQKGVYPLCYPPRVHYMSVFCKFTTRKMP